MTAAKLVKQRATWRDPSEAAVQAASASKSTRTTRKVSSNLFQQLVAGKPVVGGEAVKVIRDGFPAHILKEASGFLGVPESRIFQVVHMPPTTANRLLKNAAKIDAAVTERVYRIGTTMRIAIDVFEDADRAAQWMRQPNRTLGGVAPLDLMDTEPGASAVRQVLNAIATGGVA